MEQKHQHSLVFYRKYRPLKFADFVNQEPVKKTLQNALILNKISHAYLFAGVRGTGKTTMARLFAKAINCLNPDFKKGEPCNQCEICLEMNSGRAMDLVEIDAASNRGIDEIRDLKEGIKFSPSRNKYKVFIIDEVHMLTSQAFNALLKTLEEPPEHAVFILATTEAEKLPATILSRVQKFDFKRLPNLLIVQKLSLIAKNEKIQIDEPSLSAIARAGEGSLRDAESIFSQIVAFSPDKIITLDEVEQVLGNVRFEKIAEFLELLAKNELEKSLRFISKLQNQGFQLHEFIRISANFLEKILLLKLEPKNQEFLKNEFSAEEILSLEKLAGEFDLIKLKKFLKEFVLILSQIKKSQIPNLPIELAIIEVLEK